MTNPTSHIETVAQKVTSETSDEFVPPPNHNKAPSDLFVGLKRFKNQVRWKEFFLKKKENNNCDGDDNDNNNDNKDENKDIEDFTDAKNNDKGLGSNPRATKFNPAPCGSTEVKAFLTDVEKTLLKKLTNSL